MIHISTDYVFGSKTSKLLKEDDEKLPLNFYGESKLNGEIICKKNNPDSIIIRTSWLYSKYGSNFVKKIYNLKKENNLINVVNDQFGCPTNAEDLANFIFIIVYKN